MPWWCIPLVVSSSSAKWPSLSSDCCEPWSSVGPVSVPYQTLQSGMTTTHYATSPTCVCNTHKVTILILMNRTLLYSCLFLQDTSLIEMHKFCSNLFHDSLKAIQLFLHHYNIIPSNSLAWKRWCIESNDVNCIQTYSILHLVGKFFATLRFQASLDKAGLFELSYREAGPSCLPFPPCGIYISVNSNVMCMCKSQQTGPIILKCWKLPIISLA